MKTYQPGRPENQNPCFSAALFLAALELLRTFGPLTFIQKEDSLTGDALNGFAVELTPDAIRYWEKDKKGGFQEVLRDVWENDVTQAADAFNAAIVADHSPAQIS